MTINAYMETKNADFIHIKHNKVTYLVNMEEAKSIFGEMMVMKITHKKNGFPILHVA